MVKVLDLYCYEGGASAGYWLAGMEPFGVDLLPKGRYPFSHHQGDAIEYLLVHGRQFDLIHASPPCQRYSKATPKSHRDNHPDLIGPTREALIEVGVPWVMENVMGAPMENTTMLCGGQFGLTAEDDDGSLLLLERHRLFETSFPLPPRKCQCLPWELKGHRIAGVYGGGGKAQRSGDRGGYRPNTAVRQKLMGAPWMTTRGLTQAIPPAYTEWIAEQWLAQQ